MLAKKYRLPIQEFVKKSGKSYKSRHFLLKIFYSESARGRFGIVISKKVSPKATTRNKIKRRIFDFFGQHIAKLPVNDYLVIVLSGAAEIDKEEFLQELNKLLRVSPFVRQPADQGKSI